MKTMLARKPDNAKADRAFSQAVRARDKVCSIERWVSGKWVKHGIKGSPLNPLDAAHSYRRGSLSKSTRFDPRIGLLACRSCHVEYDSYSQLVRVPPAREQEAFDVAVAGCKVPPTRRVPIEFPNE